MSNEKQFSQGFTPNLPLWSFQLQKDSKLALKTRKDLEIHLITRALKDESFRVELITNPKTVIEQEIGSKLPDELEVTVLEETADTVYMVLPCNPYEGLSEEELQATLGMTYEDVALWVLEQQRNNLLDEESAVAIFSRAWQDQTFRRELLSTPKAVVQNELQIMISDVEICVLEESVHYLCILLPKVADNFELSNEEWLESSLFGVNLAINASFTQGHTDRCETRAFSTCKAPSTNLICF
jgi:hypothetical protein